MQEENGTNESTTSPTIEAPAVTEVVKEPELLSRRDALEVGFEAIKEKEIATKEVVKEPAAQATEIKASPELPPLKPAGEWNKEEVEDFMGLSRKQQEAALRLHKSRSSMLEEIKRNKQEFDHLKRLSESVNPYVKAMGLKDAPDVAIQKALAMWKEFEEGDPRQAAAQYLKAKGLEVPAELLNQENNSKNTDLLPIQQKVEALESEIRAAKIEQQKAVLIDSWQSFENIKNAAGLPKFPDALNESGTRIASGIGSLVSGQTELSKQFIALAQARIPDLNMSKLYEEAYKYLGGRVDDSPAAKTQEKAQADHILKSRRASASVMPRGATSNVSSGDKKLSRREALALALAEIREREGS